METTEKIETETKRILDKKAEDLTVGDALKVNLAVTAAFVAVPVIIGGAVAGVSKLAEMYQARKAAKVDKIDKDETTSTDAA